MPDGIYNILAWSRNILVMRESEVKGGYSTAPCVLYQVNPFPYHGGGTGFTVLLFLACV